MFRIWIRIPVEWFEFTFERFESLSNGSNLDSNVSNPFGMVRLPFGWLDFAFECFKSLSNGSNLHSNASNPFRMVTIRIRLLQIGIQNACQMV